MTSMEGTSLGEMLSAMRFARRSSSFRTSGTPLTPLAPSSIPTSRAPPEVLAKAMMVFNAPSGDERSRLNSNVLPSGRLRRETKSIALHFTLMSRRDCAFRVAVGNESKRTRVGTCSLNFADGVCKIFEEIPAAKSGSLCPRAHASPLFKRSELWWRRRQECGRLELKYLPQKSSQFCRQPISKSVIIGDVPIAIREGEGRGNSNRADRGRCQKSFIFQRLIDRFNCLCCIM